MEQLSKKEIGLIMNLQEIKKINYDKINYLKIINKLNAKKIMIK